MIDRTLMDARILIADDEPDNVALLEAFLADEGYRAVWSTTDAERVSEMVDALCPDIILLDLHMPRLDGFAVMEQLAARRAAEPYLPVLVLTADAAPGTRQRALAGGATDFLSKPFDVIEVGLRIRNLLETRFLHLTERAGREAAEAAARRAHLLAETSRVMGSSLDYETALAALAQLAVPALAECCVIDLQRDDGGVVQTCVAHSDPQVELELRRWDGREVAERRIVPERSDAEGVAASAGQVQSGPAISVPLMSSGRDFGRLTLVASRSNGQLTALDMGLIEEMARRAAVAVENGRLFRAAQQATRARDEVLRVVAHDLRNPLNSIMLSSGYARETGTPEAILRSAEVIARSAAQMNRLIEDLLEVARSESGTLSLQLREGSVRSLLEEVVAVLGPLAASRSIHLDAAGADDIPPVVLDFGRILQVISNLVGNAIKFTPSGGHVHVTCGISDGALKFSVADTGAGISTEHLPNIFRRFWQGGSGDRRGVGLGLSVARGIVEAHGGRIWVESTPGEGSTFFFTLPRVDPPAHPEPVGENQVLTVENAAS